MMLATFLQTEIRRPFRWGDVDCASMCDRWAQLAVGFSPLERFGRRHSGQDEAAAWLAERGGMAVAVNRVMRAAGFRKAEQPRAGDIGLVFHDKHRLCLAIHAGTVWFSRDEDGLIGAPLAACWKAWRIECRKPYR